MSLTINSTVGSSDANSYLSLSEANDMAALDVRHADQWAALTDDTKTKLLITATRQIDTCWYEYSPILDHYNQALQWPRRGFHWSMTCCARMSAVDSIIIGGYSLYIHKHLASVVIVSPGPAYGEVRTITAFDSAAGVLSTEAFSMSPGQVQIIVLDALPPELAKATLEQALSLMNSEGFGKKLQSAASHGGVALALFKQSGKHQASLCEEAKNLMAKLVDRNARIGTG